MEMHIGKRASLLEEYMRRLSTGKLMKQSDCSANELLSGTSHQSKHVKTDSNPTILIPYLLCKTL